MRGAGVRDWIGRLSECVSEWGRRVVFPLRRWCLPAFLHAGRERAARRQASDCCRRVCLSSPTSSGRRRQSPLNPQRTGFNCDDNLSKGLLFNPSDFLSYPLITLPIMSRPLNDDEVLSEMKKMVRVDHHAMSITHSDTNHSPRRCIPPQVAFIKQEAMEKAREIQVKADEEFAIEKVRCKVVQENTSPTTDIPASLIPSLLSPKSSVKKQRTLNQHMRRSSSKLRLQTKCACISLNSESSQTSD